MMEWRQKRPRDLTEAQWTIKLQKDKEYEIAVHNLSTPFYQKKHGVGVTPAEEEKYRRAKSKLWNDYKNWAIGAGLYEEITPQQQLARVDEAVDEAIVNANILRTELKRPLLESREIIRKL